jgi:tryptophan synthase alpha chain
MSAIQETFRKNHLKEHHSIMVYLNTGDPDIEMTSDLIKQCTSSEVDLIELGVPFANSFTDGDVVLRSHKRALKNNITFENTIELVKKIRTECSTPIVLLADFSHSVKSRGIKYIVEQCSISGVDGILLHGMPPLFLDEFIKYTSYYDIDPIFSLYPTTSPEKIKKTLSHSKGFVYLVTQYGRSGAPIDFKSSDMKNFFNSVRNQTDLPLMAGFGIKNTDDIKNIFSTHSVNGVIMGSAICKIIESSMPSRKNTINNVSDYLKNIVSVKKYSYKTKTNTRNHNEYTTSNYS